jgi:hypothetical protein
MQSRTTPMKFIGNWWGLLLAVTSNGQLQKLKPNV